MKKYLLPIMLMVACQSQEISAPEPVYPIPSERQLDWHKLEYYGFIHFNMNTFSDMEWGMGDESPTQFDPRDLDTRQWAKVVKDAGMKGIIITAKHHDGFCLWPSAYTEHSIKNSPWKKGEGDLIKELAEACAEYGLKFGIYYSPWDRNHADYGKPEYITYMRNQLTELLTNYGEIFEVWFDGANGGDGYYGGANETRRVDKKSYYDWENTFALVRELQPKAVIFGDAGPDVRWVGNEHGFAYETTWANLLRDSVYAGMPEYADLYAPGQENGTHWVPAEADVSIRPGWYYHAYEDHKVKTLPQLLDIYYKSIGQNSSLLINFPVDRRGLIHENDKEQILKLADKINEDFKNNLAEQAKFSASNERGKGFEAENMKAQDIEKYWAAPAGKISSEITLDFKEPVIFNRFLIQEYYPLGQRVKKFSIEAKTDQGWQMLHQGTTIGAKRILRLEDTQATAIRLNILDAKACPTIAFIGVYVAPKLLLAPELKREKSGQVALIAPESGLKVYYTLDGTEPGTKSTEYHKPFEVNRPTELRAVSYDANRQSISESLIMELDIPKANWKVLNADAGAEKAIDESAETFWVSPQNQILIDLGDSYLIKGLHYLPPQNRYMQGIISHYSLEISLDGNSWKKQAGGEFSNIQNNPIQQLISFQTVKARYIKLKAEKTLDGNPASFAEVGVLSDYE